ncbi:MAG TPA: TldD/PmbA family protein [Candidatus Bathyarchaeia archaeon]|nr:TldD/PmbA family protein [Candidatus Bathyarchaeia archaeon]
MTADILSLLDPFVAKALKLGADEVEFFAQRLKNKTANFEANNLKSAVSTILDGVGIRVLKNKALGFTSVNSLKKDKILEGLKEAFAIAKVTPPEPNYYLPSKQLAIQVSDIYDPAIESFSMDDTINSAKLLLNTATAYDPRISIDSGLFQAAIIEKAIATSTGINNSEMKSALSFGLFGMAIDGDDIGSFDYEFDTVIKVSEVNVEKLATDFAVKILGNLGSKKTNSFEGTAVFTPDTTQELFSLVIDSAKATAIQAGASYLQDKLGEVIAVKDLTIIDDGTIKGSPGSSAFDREGVTRKKLNVIDKGTFTGVFYDTFTANKESLASTGHAGGSFRNIPNIVTTNLNFKPGKTSIDAILPEIKKGILIKRISASPDPVSGDFSAAIKGGQLIENGEVTDTLKEITAVGNVYSALKSISHVSKEQKPIRGEQTWFVPYLSVDNIKFAS